jgi:hypothetical protein
MTAPGAHRVILRGAPPADRYRAPGGVYRGPSLSSRLCLHVAAAADAGADDDRFGMAGLLVARGRSLLHAVLVVPDETPRGVRAALDVWASAHRVETAMGPAPWRVVSLSAFTDPRATRARAPWAFVPNAYSGRCTVVGPDLGRTFALMAEHVVERRGAHRGTWEVWLPGWGVVGEAGNVRRASPHRPALRVEARRVGWTVAFGPTERGNGKATRGGESVDLLSLAYALDADRGAGYVEHAADLGETVAELPIAVTVDPDGAGAMARAVTESWRLALVLDDHAGRWLTTSKDRSEGTHCVPVARLRSPAALADHLLRRFGVGAPHVTWGLSPDEHRTWAEPFHGGWTESDPAFYAVPFSCAALDVIACYPLVAHWLGWWEAVTCTRVERRHVTRQLRALCARAVHDPTVMLDPTVWARFGLCLVEVVCDGEPFVVAVDDPRRPDGRSEVVPVYCSGRSMFYAWPDVVAAAVRSRRVPRIVEAVRLVPVERQAGLPARVSVFPGLVCDAETDPVLAWVARRQRAKAEGDATLAAQLHAAVNSLVSGNPSRLDPEWRKVSGKWTLCERFGPWTCFPLAASVTAGGRLVLALLDRMVKDLDSRVGYRDTDSSVLPSSPDGGTLTLPDGSTLRELSWGELDELVGAFAPLSPAAWWPVWKVERGSEERPLHCVAFGPKRHAEFSLGPHGPELARADTDDDAPELSDWTETGLGGHWADPCAMPGRCADGGRAWSKAAVLREVRYALAKAADPANAPREPAPWDTPDDAPFPTLRRLQVSAPALLASLPRALGARMGARYVEGVVDSRNLRREVVRSVVALDPGGPLDPFTLRWLDRMTGETVRVTTDPMDTGAVLLETLATRAGDFGARPRSEPVESVTVTPFGVVYRGRVSGVIDAADAGMSGDLRRERPVYEDDHGLAPGERDALVALAKSLPRKTFARLAGCTTSTVRMIADGKLPRPSAARRIVRRLSEAQTHRTCALDGCSHPVTDPRATYCTCPDHSPHRWVSQKRRERGGRR